MHNKVIRSVLLFGLLCSMSILNAQSMETKHIHPEAEYDNVHVKKMHSDDRSTTFLIWVREKVKPHKHAAHTEVIVVLKGKGMMTVGDQTKQICKGDLIIVPQGTVHSVITTSRKPLQVVSVQSPVFLGKDRIWIEEK